MSQIKNLIQYIKKNEKGKKYTRKKKSPFQGIFDE
jgi:hypothetical protein